VNDAQEKAGLFVDNVEALLKKQKQQDPQQDPQLLKEIEFVKRSMLNF